ncbi:7797_t:CDS:2 [Ambispora leptoticha]|uniref:7797_t:CDS:1 n=1 Tax=Ambispora leptoticha TaxID=144679 RepID=A0A9N8WE83_9GLOM|nr:7797_t:CDS:2 [Ambispora leptoticha]
MSFPTNTEHMLRYPEVQVQQPTQGLFNEDESRMFNEFLNSWIVEEPVNNVVFQHPLVSDVSFGVPSPSILTTSRGGYQASTGYGTGFGTGSQTITTSNGYMYPITSATTIPNNNTYATSAFQNGGIPHQHHNHHLNNSFVETSSTYPTASIPIQTHNNNNTGSIHDHHVVNGGGGGGKVVSTPPYIKTEPSSSTRRQRSPSLPLSVNVESCVVASSSSTSTTINPTINNQSSSSPKLESQGETSSSTSTPNPTASTSSSSSNRGGRGKKGHELLTEAEKKANHIASEQKRRQHIRMGFDQLVEIVPTLSQCHRSEALILQKSVEYIQQLLIQKSELKERVKSLQATLGDAPEHLDDSSSEGELDLIF